MAINLVAYTYLEAGGQVPSCSFHSISPQIETYLENHLQDLLARGRRGTSAPAVFREQRALDRFERLLNGSRQEFLATAQDLTDRLHTAMDARSKRGFFVVLRQSDDEETVRAAALKLDVRDEVAAAARTTQQGELVLEAVQDLLDLQGELQKGAVYPDARPDSDVVVGDKLLTETALYFLRAVQVQQFARETSAGGILVSVVQKVAPEKTQPFVDELSDQTAPFDVEQFLTAHPDLLDPGQAEDFRESLAHRDRPVRTVAPKIQTVVRADGITVKGPARRIRDQVNWYPSAGGWQIVIDVSTEPRVSYE